MYCETCATEINFPNVTLAQENMYGVIYYTCFLCIVTEHRESAAQMFDYLRHAISFPSNHDRGTLGK